MKIINLFSFFIVLLICSCSDKEAKSIVDCFGESLLIDVKHTSSESNQSQINFNVTYSGDHAIDNMVKWDFGDGKVQTTNGIIANHTYDKSGTYTVVAKVGLNNGGCSYDIKETVVIP